MECSSIKVKSSHCLVRAGQRPSPRLSRPLAFTPAHEVSPGPSCRCGFTTYSC